VSGGGVEIDADRIHRILDDGVEDAARAGAGAGEPDLIDVMLILSTPIAYGSILTSSARDPAMPCDRYGAAQGHVEIGRFGIGHGRCE